ncbi:MAG: metal ABC transporter permease [Bacteriovoracaceae bacterium]|nr:metal ABC transporter permease [Bacteriovoracaceae bacterium]
MSELIQVLFNPDTPFLLYAFIAAIFSSVAFGVLGSFVVAKKISYLAGAISHSVLGGIGLALYLQSMYGLAWFSPMFGAILVALLSALIIGILSLKGRQRSDTIIGAMWAFGMASGVLFISKTPGNIDLMSYMFGNILMISKKDLYPLFIFDIIIVVIISVFYNKFLAICFDEEFARLRGIKVELYYFMLLGLIAVSIVLLVRMVGIILVIALFTIPAAIGSIITKTLKQMIFWAILFCLLFSITGLSISYIYDIPSGAAIIMVSVVAYFATLLLQAIAGRQNMSNT